MKNYVMALDAGKHLIKALGREITEAEAGADVIEHELQKLERVSFRTKKFDLTEKDLEVQGNSYKVLFGEDEIGVILGDQGISASFETSKTNDLHRLCAYTAISQFLIPGTTDNKIYMSLACPVDIVKIATEKEAYKNFIKGNGPIKITVNDLDYEFEIVDIVIKSEGSGTTYTHPEYFVDKDTLLIDLGGLNLSVQAYLNKVLSGKDEDRFSEEFGGNKLNDYVRESLKIYRKGNDVKLEEVETALKDGFLYKQGEADKGSTEYIIKGKERYVEAMIDLMSSKGQKLENRQELVFVGGTTSRVQDQVRAKFKNARIPQDPQWDSIYGLYKVAYARYIIKNKK